MIYISRNNSARNDVILSADPKIMVELVNQWLVTFSPSQSCDMILAIRGSPESPNFFFILALYNLILQQKWGIHIA